MVANVERALFKTPRERVGISFALGPMKPLLIPAPVSLAGDLVRKIQPNVIKRYAVLRQKPDVHSGTLISRRYQRPSF